MKPCNLHQCTGYPTSRRAFLKTASAAGMAWLSPISHSLAFSAENDLNHPEAKAVVLLWLAGGPSQLETFDPHPGSDLAPGVNAIDTSIPGLQIARELEPVAGLMDQVSLIRSMTSLEGDHERGVYNIKTGYRPDPTVVHPSLGAILSHQLPTGAVEIPNHISILPNQWPARGGYLGGEFDAFQIGDPADPVPDVTNRVDDQRLQRRLESLDVVERAFLEGRDPDLDIHKTRHRATMNEALRMMGSDQVKAFEVQLATESERAAYGDTDFGRGCLAARRLIETGVRCVEVTLDGWDSHVNNRDIQTKCIATLAPALAALIQDLKDRDLLKKTVVLCGGEFGRSPTINPLEGRDHWPHGFSFLAAGGGFARGKVLGSTDPKGESKEPDHPVRVADLHATVQHLLGLDPEKEIITPVGRPIALSEGRVLNELLADG